MKYLVEIIVYLLYAAAFATLLVTYDFHELAGLPEQIIVSLSVALLSRVLAYITVKVYEDIMKD